MSSPDGPREELLGYGDRLSVAAGGSMRFMVSSTRREYEAAVVRLLHGDTQSAGPGFTEREIGADVDGTYAGHVQLTPCGSYARVDPEPLGAAPRSWTLHSWVLPTAPRSRRLQAILSRGGPGGGTGVFVERGGELSLRLGTGWPPPVVVAGDSPMRSTWYWIAATYDADANVAALHQIPLDPMIAHECSYAWVDGVAPVDTSGPFLMAAARVLRDGTAEALFDGKIDAPAYHAVALEREALHEIRSGRDPATRSGQDLLGAWDFSLEIDGDAIVDRGRLAAHGRLVNMPARAATGHNWTGRHADFRVAKNEYGAIHFHSDDLSDARWTPSFEWTVPVGTPSGVYAIRLRAGNEEDHIPFVVRAPRIGARGPGAVLLLPTMTYLAYANERCLAPEHQPVRRRDSSVADEPLDSVLAAHPELGLSLYDTHADGSGCCYSSRLRPILNLRPRYNARIIDAARHFAADLYLVDWLEAQGHQYDVVTDEDLHREGHRLLEPYRVVLTGSHPEYCTEAMLDALEAHVRSGGRLMYLGGNGFYWVTSLGGQDDHVIEVRRGVAGTRNWNSAPGESHHSTSGEPGGLWRHRGRPPNRLVGVGFGALGQDGAAKGYRRLPGSFDPRAEFIFRGVAPEEVIGDFGLAMGGAAGDEIDRTDEALGTPPGTLRLASASGFSDYYQVAVEDSLQTTSNGGGTQDPRVRADMVYLECPNGGAVFSVGSMTWSASLSQNRYDNNVSRITENVLSAFTEPPHGQDGSHEAGTLDRRAAGPIAPSTVPCWSSRTIEDGTRQQESSRRGS